MNLTSLCKNVVPRKYTALNSAPKINASLQVVEYRLSGLFGCAHTEKKQHLIHAQAVLCAVLKC